MLHYRDSIVMNYFTTQKIQTKQVCNSNLSTTVRKLILICSFYKKVMENSAETIDGQFIHPTILLLLLAAALGNNYSEDTATTESKDSAPLCDLSCMNPTRSSNN